MNPGRPLFWRVGLATSILRKTDVQIGDVHIGDVPFACTFANWGHPFGRMGWLGTGSFQPMLDIVTVSAGSPDEICMPTLVGCRTTR